jgi:hypothetical protein
LAYDSPFGVFLMGWQEEEKRLFVELPTLLDRTSPFIVVATMSCSSRSDLVGTCEGIGGRFERARSSPMILESRQRPREVSTMGTARSDERNLEASLVGFAKRRICQDLLLVDSMAPSGMPSCLPALL